MTVALQDSLRGRDDALPLLHFCRVAADVEVSQAPGEWWVRGTTDLRWVYGIVDSLDSFEPELAPSDVAFAALQIPVAERLLRGRATLWRQEGWTVVWPAALPVYTAPAVKGYVLRSLSLEAAPTVDAFWAQRHPGSLALVQDCIRRRPSVGTWDSAGDLVGWSVVLDDGAVGASFVRPEHRKRGIQLAQLAQLGTWLHEKRERLYLHLGEEAAVQRHEALGFEVGPRRVWFRLMG